MKLSLKCNLVIVYRGLLYCSYIPLAHKARAGGKKLIYCRTAPGVLDTAENLDSLQII